MIWYDITYFYKNLVSYKEFIEILKYWNLDSFSRDDTKITLSVIP